jgi:hypothetical protein
MPTQTEINQAYLTAISVRIGLGKVPVVDGTAEVSIEETVQVRRTDQREVSAETESSSDGQAVQVS